MNAYEVYLSLIAQGKGRKKALQLIGCAALLDDAGWKGLRIAKGRRSIVRALAAAGVLLPADEAPRPFHRKRCRRGVTASGAGHCRQGVMLSGSRAGSPEARPSGDQRGRRGVLVSGSRD